MVEKNTDVNPEDFPPDETDWDLAERDQWLEMMGDTRPPLQILVDENE